MTETARPVDPERLLAHEDFVRAVARALLRDPHAADDVVQETFVAALRGSRASSRAATRWARTAGATTTSSAPR